MYPHLLLVVDMYSRQSWLLRGIQEKETEEVIDVVQDFQAPHIIYIHH
jgi:hypothetical protein